MPSGLPTTCPSPRWERLERGLLLPPDPRPTLPAKAAVTGRSTLYQIADQIPPRYREKLLKNRDIPVVAGTLTLTEGRTHQVRAHAPRRGMQRHPPAAGLPGPAAPGETCPAARGGPLEEAEITALWGRTHVV